MAVTRHAIAPLPHSLSKNKSNDIEIHNHSLIDNPPIGTYTAETKSRLNIPTEYLETYVDQIQVRLDWTTWP